MAATNPCQCCFCCVNDDQKISKVLARFPPQLPTAAVPDGTVQKLVGNVVLQPNGPALRSPLTGRPCAYYDVKVEERRQSHNKNGTSYHWVVIATERRSVDFFIQDDGGGSVFVPGGSVKAYTVDDGGARTGGGFMGLGGQAASPGLAALLQRQGKSATSFFGCNKTLRASEGCFEAGEAVACLGTVNPGAGGPTMQLGPLRADALSDEWMTKNGWNDWDKKSWTSLTGKFSCVLISDHASLVGGLVHNKRPGQPAPMPQQMLRGQQPSVAMSPTVVAPAPGPMPQPAAVATVTAVVVPPQPITMQVAVPPSAGPGTTLQLQTPDGRRVQVQVPAGVAPGQMFQIQV